MTPPPENRFGRAGGPSMAQIKEYSTLETVSFIGAINDAVLLADASGLAGGSSESYYLIWGVTAVTTTSAAFFGMIYDSNIAHGNNQADGATYLGFGANFQGPFFWNTEQPIKVTSGSGIQLDRGAGGGTELLTVIYSIVHAGV
jgi:hypothetical protein